MNFLFMLVDFHTHYFPDRIAIKAIQSLETSSGLRADNGGTLAALQNSMLQAKVDLSVILPIAANPKQMHVVNDCALLNNQLKGICSFGSVHPDAEDWRTEMKRISESGLKGIKLHPDFQGIDLDDCRMVEVIAEAARLHLIVVLHSGLDLSYPDYQRSTPQKLFNILPEIRGAQVVMAHSGGFSYLDDVERMLLNCDEVYIDTSFSVGYRCMPIKQLERIYQTINPSHVLFGSDTPWENQLLSYQKLMSLKLSDTLRERILYKNALELLRITE